jgi:hypothetical protein
MTQFLSLCEACKYRKRTRKLKISRISISCLFPFRWRYFYVQPPGFNLLQPFNTRNVSDCKDFINAVPVNYCWRQTEWMMLTFHDRKKSAICVLAYTWNPHFFTVHSDETGSALRGPATQLQGNDTSARSKQNTRACTEEMKLTGYVTSSSSSCFVYLVIFRKQQPIRHYTTVECQWQPNSKRNNSSPWRWRQQAHLKHQ